VREEMALADRWAIARVGYVETARALALAAGDGSAAVGAFESEWPLFAVVEIDEELARRAVELSVAESLRSLDAIHLAAALTLPESELRLATWDVRLHGAAAGLGISLAPNEL